MGNLSGGAAHRMVIFGGMSPWLLVVGVALAALFVGLAFAAQRGIVRLPLKLTAFVLRFGALSLALIALAAPTLRSEEPVPHQSFMAHVYDTSASMGIADCDGQTRIAAVNTKALASPTRTELNRLYRGLDYTFDEKLTMRTETGGLSAGEQGTDLAGAFRALSAQLKGLPVTGVVLYSDGNATSGGEQAILDAASNLDAPVYCIGSAPQRPAADVWIEKVNYADEAILGVNSKVSVLVGSRGMSGATVDVVLKEDGREIKRRSIPGSREERTANADFEIHPSDVGPHGYEVEVSASRKEAYPWNNKQSFFVNAVQKKRRILYVEGYPRYEYRFLRAAFEDDERFQVTSLVYLDKTGKTYRQGLDTASQLSKGFPEKQEELFEYDVVVIGDIPADRFNTTQLTALREFVRTKGGGLLFLAGDDSFDPKGYAATPLADVLPFTFSATPKLAEKRRVIPTREGIERALFGPYDPAKRGDAPWTILPAIQGLFPLTGLKPGAIPLCTIEGGEGDDAPVVAYQRYGRGTSLICGVSATWQWKFQVPSENPSYAAFWKEMALILVEQTGERLQVKSTPATVAPGHEVTIEVTALDEKYHPDPTAKVTLEIRTPGGEASTVTPQPNADGTGLQHVLTPAESGIYRVVAKMVSREGPALEKAAMFLVEQSNQEMKVVKLNEPLLTEIAALTGGQYIPLDDFEKLPELVKPRNGSVIKVREKPMWDNASLLTALIVALTCEWLIRRVGNLA